MQCILRRMTMATKSKQPMSGSKARSGGGAPMNKVRGVGIKTGSANLKAVPPTHASHIGRSVGNHSEYGTTNRPATPGPVAKKDFVAMGNAKALDGAGSGERPGGGNRNINPTGSQSQNGPINRRETPRGTSL